ncbi:MAG: helix-turn-helix domain-containing protein [Verrucomicrobiota bacterium]
MSGLLRANWRKGSFLNPFCHLVIRAVRWDSPPGADGQPSLSRLLIDYRAGSDLTQELLAAQLGVSLKTVQNWERGRTKPCRTFWWILKEMSGTSRKAATKTAPLS